MDNVTANPLFVGLLCLARCLVPVIIMLGITYLLKRFGVFAEPPPPPNNYEENNNNPGEGGLAHDGT
jgi:hypothetical protein